VTSPFHVTHMAKISSVMTLAYLKSMIICIKANLIKSCAAKDSLVQCEPDKNIRNLSEEVKILQIAWII
jgi:hypothetical protein